MAAPLNDFETISPRKLVDTETTRPSPTPCISLPDRAKGRFEEDNVTKSHPRDLKVNAVTIVGFLPNVSKSMRGGLSSSFLDLETFFPFADLPSSFESSSPHLSAQDG